MRAGSIYYIMRTQEKHFSDCVLLQKPCFVVVVMNSNLVELLEKTTHTDRSARENKYFYFEIHSEGFVVGSEKKTDFLLDESG